jgi:uncharacterized membrane protein
MSTSILTITFEFFLITLIVNVILTITYAVYLIIEEKKLTGFISTRRILESSLTITGAISSAMWFMIIFIIFYGPLIFGAVASAVIVTLTYAHSHFLPSKLTELVAAGNILALAVVAYAVGGPTLAVFVVTMVITSLVIAEGFMELVDRWLS